MYLVFHVNFVIKILFLWEDIHGTVKQESQQLQLPLETNNQSLSPNTSLTTQNNNNELKIKIEK